MEFENSDASSPCVYMTAPNSRSSIMEFYYSAPASPRWRADCEEATDDHPGSSFDEFEFDTSKMFSSQQQSEASEYPASGDGGQKGRGMYRVRGDSLPAMAFADELFLNGIVMPLKPPPRLHSDIQFKSPLSSPRTASRIPFARKSSWNDDFDPFMVALEKVREEKRGRNSHHKRSRSFSPFRATPKSSSNENIPMEPAPAPSYSGPLDFKGSAYARWVRDQTRHGVSPKSSRKFLFRQRVRPLKTEQDVSDKPAQPTGTHAGKKYGKTEESRVQKLKGLLVRYASFGRVNSGIKQTRTSSEARKVSYFGRLSFKFRGSAHSNSKQKITADTNMAVVQSVL